MNKRNITDSRRRSRETDSFTSSELFCCDRRRTISDLLVLNYFVVRLSETNKHVFVITCKGTLLSKALACMNIFLYKLKWPDTQYVNWNKHPVPIPPSSRLIHYELQHSCVTSCRKSWCESCWYSCNFEGPPIKIHFSIDLSNCYSYNHVIMWLPIPCNLAYKLVFDTERLWLWASRFLTKQNAKEETVKIMELNGIK